MPSHHVHYATNIEALLRNRSRAFIGMRLFRLGQPVRQRLKVRQAIMNWRHRNRQLETEKGLQGSRRRHWDQVVERFEGSI